MSVKESDRPSSRRPRLLGGSGRRGQGEEALNLALGERLRGMWERRGGLPQGRRDLYLAGLALVVALVSLPWPGGAGAAASCLGLAGLVFILFKTILAAWLGERPAGYKDLLFLASLMVLALLSVRGYFLFAGALTRAHAGLDSGTLAFGAPLALAPLLAALFLGRRKGLLMALAGALLLALSRAPSGDLFFYYLVSGSVAAHLAAAQGTRLDLVKAGLRSAGAGALVLAALALYRGWLLSGGVVLGLLAVGLGGALAGVLAAGLAPLAELIFGYTTSTRYLELASLDHPLLRELMLKAPGTYHHSLVVSSLAEAAAREIGANHRLARAAALFHDIGKLKKADYFVENQMGGPNRHAKLAPSMSALILISHVKEGVETARRHRLSPAIIDIMAQHHGTRLIHFFYNKAQDQRRRSGRGEPDPEAFRYPGPRPQSREAALVMLADTVEAACRALEHPAPARIKGTVQTEINKIFSEGQLDQCDLTLRDLHRIAGSFHSILVGIFHQRVEYPRSPEGTGGQDGDRHRQPGGPEPRRYSGDRAAASSGLGRLGLS